MKTSDALLNLIGFAAARKKLEAAGWREVCNDWLAPVEEPKKLIWHAPYHQGTLQFPWGYELVDDSVAAINWVFSDPLSGSWKYKDVQDLFGWTYYSFQYVPAPPPPPLNQNTVWVPSEMCWSINDERLRELRSFVDREIAYFEKYIGDRADPELYIYEVGRLHALKEVKSKML